MLFWFFAPASSSFMPRSCSSTRSILYASTFLLCLSAHMALPNYLVVAVLAPLPLSFRPLGLQVIRLFRIELFD